MRFVVQSMTRVSLKFVGADWKNQEQEINNLQDSYAQKYSHVIDMA